VKRKDITGVTIKKNANSVKYKLRGGKYLYTFVLTDVSRANKIRVCLNRLLWAQFIVF